MSNSAPKPPLVTRDALREIGLFGGLADETLDLLAIELELRSFAPGASVVSEGDHARELFVILDGELEVVRKSRAGHEGRVALLGPGSWFGEMSILDPQPRSATVRVVAPADLLRIGAEDLERIYRRDPKAYLLLVMNMARELSRRLRIADRMIVDFLGALWDGNLGYERKR